MAVSLDEPRHRHPASELDHARRGAKVRVDLRRSADRDNSLALDGDRVGLWLAVIDGDDPTAAEDEVCRFGRECRETDKARKQEGKAIRRGLNG